jgi:MFS family permease
MTRGTTRRSPLPVTLRALQHRNFRLFFGGQLVSLIGTWMQNVAQSWLVYRLTGSSVLLGTVNFANQIPVFLLAAGGGAVADRYNRHRIIIATQTAAMALAFVLALLTLTGHIRVWQVVVLSALLGTVYAFDMPARQSFLVSMVGKADLMNAIALNSSMFNGARLVGPAIAGLLVAGIGEGWCFLLNGASFLAVIIGLLLMQVEPHQPAARSEPIVRDVINGFRFVTRNDGIHALLMLLGVVSIAGAPFSVLMPIFAGQILHGGAQELGLLTGASGLGALAGALILASRRTIRGLGPLVAVAAGAFGGALILFSVSKILWLSLALLVPAGFFLMLHIGATNTLIQSMSPDQVRGRVMAVYSMVMMGLAPAGALLSGIAAAKVGAPATVAAGGLVCMFAAAAFAAYLPKLRFAEAAMAASVEVSR